MFKRRLNIKNDRKGAILAYVIILLLIISIIASSIVFVFSSNLKLAKHQEDNMRAYYLVHSGIDITLSTLLNPLYVEGGVEKSIIDKIKKDNKTIQLADYIEIEGKKVDITVNYVKNSNAMTIKSSTLLDSGDNKELSLKLEFSGGKFKTRWN